MATSAEVTMVCLDNSFWMHGHPLCGAQVEAVKLYCDFKFKCNAENRVGLFRMASYHHGTLVSPTNDLRKILNFLPGVRYECGGQAEFSIALQDTCAHLAYEFPNMKRRILVFVGSPINLHWSSVEPVGKFLKKHHVALDVVNLFLLGEDRSRVEYSILYGKYHYGREQLNELLTFANDNGNCQIVDYLKKDDDDESSSVCELLKEHILKNEKNNAAAEYSKPSAMVMDSRPGENERVKLKAD